MLNRCIDLTGMTFGRWTVLSRVENDKHGNAQWLCRCVEGNERVVRGSDLRRGNSQNCGCVRRESVAKRSHKHGHARKTQTTAEYHAWRDMRNRCHNPRNKKYRDYGGRGIRVCWRWLSENGFQLFLEDMGPKPEPKRLYSIDRYPNNDGNYEPSNCRWATASQQRTNQRPAREWKKAA
jgi:hypothetical protein